MDKKRLWIHAWRLYKMGRRQLMKLAYKKHTNKLSRIKTLKALYIDTSLNACGSSSNHRHTIDGQCRSVSWTLKQNQKVWQSITIELRDCFGCFWNSSYGKVFIETWREHEGYNLFGCWQGKSRIESFPVVIKGKGLATSEFSSHPTS